MSKFQQQRDIQQERSLRAWSTEHLKDHLFYSRREEHSHGMHKEARRMFKQNQRALEAELARRLGPEWEERDRSRTERQSPDREPEE